jgi:hypothetical protein
MVLLIDSEDVRDKLQAMQQSGWINAYTSAVVIEMTLFHVQSTLFASVLLALELPPVGLVRTSNRILSVYLYKYVSPMDHFVLACEVRTILFHFCFFCVYVCVYASE